MENLRDIASTSGTATLHPLLSPGQVQLSKVMDGSSWLHVQVCRDFLRGTCTFSETQCNFAHPQPHIKVRNNHINACYDNIKGTCNRNRPPCKYFHPPEHIKEELVVAGRQHLALKKALIQKMAACEPGQPFNTEEVFEGETKLCKPEVAMPNVQKREPEEESENKLNTKQCRYVEPSKKRMKEFIDQNPVEMGDTMSLVRVVSALLRRGNSSLMFKTPESLCPVEPVRLSVPHESLCKRIKLVTGTNVPMKNAPLCFGTKVDEGQVEIFTGKESTVAPAIKNAFKAFQNFVKTSGKPLWDPRTSTGFWQGVSLRCNSAGEVMLHATVMGSSTAESKEIMEELTPKLTQFFSWGRGQPSKVVTIGISIVPDEEDVPHLVMGKGYLDEVVMNMRLRLFRQTFMWNSHTGMNDVCEILAKICSSQRIFQVLQLGCNPGLFGHYLARFCETVHGIDERPIVDAAAITAQENDIFNCHYRDGDAWKVLPNLEFELKHGGDTLAILHDESCHIWNHDVLLLLRKMPFVRKLVYLTSYSSDFIVDLEILSTMQEEMVDFFHPTNVVPIQTTTMSKDHLLVFILDKVEDTQARDRAVRMSYDTFRSVEGDLPHDRTFTGSVGKKANFNNGREIFSDRETVRKDERRIFPYNKNYENRVRDISKRTSPQRAIDISRNNTDNNRSKISPFKEIKRDTKKNFNINRNRKTSQDNDRCRGRFNDRSKDRRISPAKDKNAGKRSPVKERSGGGISPANERSRNKRSSPSNDRSGNRKSSPANDRSANRKSSPANDNSGNSKSSPANDRNRRKSSPANGKSRNRKSSPACDRSRNRKSSPANDRSRNKSPANDRSRNKSPANDRSRNKSPANDRSRNKSPANDRSRNKSPANDRSRNKSPANDRSRNKSPANDRSRNKSPAKDRDQNKGNHTNTHKAKDIKSIPYSKNQGKQSSTDEIKAGTSRSRVENKQKNIDEPETADQHANNASASTPRNVQEMKAKFIKFLTSLQEEEQEKKPTAQSNESTDNVIANTLLETLQEIFPTSKLDANTANMLRNTILDAFKTAGVLEKKETITIETTDSQSKTQCKIDPKFPKENIYSSVYRKIRRKMLSGTPTNSKTSFKPEGQSDSQILKKSTELADSLFAQCLQTNFASKHFKSKNELSSYFLKPISKRSIRRMSLPLPSNKKPKTEPLSSSTVSSNPAVALIPSTVSSDSSVAIIPSNVSNNPPVALNPSKVSSNSPVALIPSKVSNNPPVALIPSTVSSNPPVAIIPSKVSNNPLVALNPKVSSNPPVALIPSKVSSNSPVALIPSKVSSNPPVALIHSKIPNNPSVALIPSKVPSNPPVALILSKVSSNPPVALIPSKVSSNPPVALIPSKIPNNPSVALIPSKVPSNPPVALIPSTVSSNLPVALNPSKVSSNPPVALIPSTVSSNPPVALIPSTVSSNTPVALIPSKVSSNPPVALIPSKVSSNPPVALIPSKVSNNPPVALSQIPSTLPFPPHFQITRHTAHASAPKKDSPLPLQRNLFSNFKSASQSMSSSNDPVLFDPRLPPPPLIKANIIASSPLKSHNTTLSTKDLPGMIPGMKHQLAGRYSTEDHFVTSYFDRKLNPQVQSHIPHSNIKETNENHRVEHTYNSESVEEIAYFNKPSTMSNVYSEAKDVPFIMDYKETRLPPSNVKPSNFPNYQFKDSPHDRFSQHEFSPPKKIFRGNTFLKHREDSFQSYDHSESVNTLHRFEPYTPRHDNIFTRRSDHSHIREHTARYDQMEDVNASLHSPWEVRNDLHSHVQDNLIRCDTLGIESANRQHMLSQEPERYADYRRVGSFPSRLSGTTQENVQLYHKDSFHQDISRRNAISHMQDLLTKHNILLPVKSGVSDPLKRSDPPSMNLSNIRNVPKQHYSDSFENRFTLDRSNSSIDICEAGFLDSNRIKHYSQISNNY